MGALSLDAAYGPKGREGYVGVGGAFAARRWLVVRGGFVAWFNDSVSTAPWSVIWLTSHTRVLDARR